MGSGTQAAAGSQMTFDQALRAHLQAIRDRDIAELAPTIARDRVVLIMSDGKLVRDPGEFLQAHRDWFRMDNWTMQTDPVHTWESTDLGVAVLHLTYREEADGKPPVVQESYLTLVFERRAEGWVMVQDQNTPVRNAASV